MTPEPRHQDDYSARQIEAARRVLIDVGQILGSYVMKAIAILKEKFASVDSFGPGQIIEFHNSNSEAEKKRQARRAFEVVQALLKLL